MNLEIIGLAGKARSGKDTVAYLLSKHYGFTRYALADPLKEAARSFFSLNDEELHGNLKDEIHPIWRRTPRQLLIEMGTEYGRKFIGSDLWLKNLEIRLQRDYEEMDDVQMDMFGGSAPRIVISDIRFDNEAEWIRSRGGKVWLLQRPNGPGCSADNDPTERGINPALVNATIANGGSLHDLQNSVQDAYGMRKYAA